MTIKKFEISIPSEQIDDLHRRLDATLWPDQVSGTHWEQGTDSAYLRELADYWRNDFDWRAVEAELNEFPQFTMEIQGLEIHFLHIAKSGEKRTPLLLSHGWPSSFAEMCKLIPLLEGTFDLVIPSLPGFIFSSASPGGGMNATRIAEVFDEMMGRLGYDRYATHGGDIGAAVSTALALNYPDRVLGTHITSVALVTPWIDADSPALTDAEQAYNRGRQQWMAEEGAYYMIQSTKPLSLSYGLTDSPIGLAAWIIEKFRAWSDCGGNVESRFSKDELLTSISLYWFTKSIGSANRFYYENRKSPLKLQKGQRIAGINGASVFHADISLPPRAWIERTFELGHYNFLEEGGHFSALEVPEKLAQEIHASLGSISPLLERR